MTRRQSGAILAIGIDYTATSHGSLPDTPQDAERISSLFRTLGFASADEGVPLAHANAVEIIAAVAEWAREAATSTDSLILYVGGHGRMHLGRHFILTRSSPAQAPYSSINAISALDLIECIINSGASQALILLDTCRAGYAASEMNVTLHRSAASTARPPTRVAVLASTLHHEQSYAGLFVGALVSSIDDGSVTQRHWRDMDPYITPGELCEEIRDRLGDHQFSMTAGNESLRIVPNPRFRSPAPDRPVELSHVLAALPPDDREHFLLHASGSDIIDLGWHFSGRRGTTRRILEWLKETRQGVLILTGSPGTGKSAILGRLAVLADRRANGACVSLGLKSSDADLIPELGTFDAVVHLKNRSLNDVASLLSAEFGFADISTVVTCENLLDNLRNNLKDRTVLLDALDEAAPGNIQLIAVDLVRQLAQIPGFKIVIGSRRQIPVRDLASTDSLGPLAEMLLDENVRPSVIDLDQDPESEGSIASYVYKRLSGIWSDADAVQTAASKVASLCQGVFLLARFAVRALQLQESAQVFRQDWHEQIISDITKGGFERVIRADIERQADPEAAQDLLGALAFSRGKGLPRREVWATVATTLSLGKRIYTDDDVSAIISDAAWYLVEAVEEGQTVFRLYHQAIAEVLAGMLTPLDVIVAHQRICATFVQCSRSNGWSSANPYITRYLASHAATGECLGEIVDDVDFLSHADLDVLTEALGTGITANTPDLVRTYLQSGESLRGQSPSARKAVLALHALMTNRPVTIEKSIGAPWWPRWARLRRVFYTRALFGHISSIYTLTFVGPPDEIFLLSGSGDGIAHIWSLHSGRSIGQLARHDNWIRSATWLDTSYGRTLLTSDGNLMNVWDLRTLTLLHQFDAQVGEILSISPVPGQRDIAAVSGDQGTVCIWNIVGARIEVKLEQHSDWVRTLAAIAVDHGGILAAGGDDNFITLWDTNSWSVLSTLHDCSESTYGMAFITLEDKMLLAAGGSSNEIFVWDLANSRIVMTLQGHTDWITGLSASNSVKRPIIASASTDGTLRIWSVSDGACAQLLEGHSDVIWSVDARTGDDGGLLIASGGHDRTVRLWAPDSQKVLAGQTKAAATHCVALAGSKEGDVVISADDDGRIFIRDRLSGQLVTDWKAHHSAINCISAVDVGFSHFLASVGSEGHVCIWSTEGQLIIDFEGPDRTLRAVTFIMIEGELFVAVGGDDRMITVWSVSTGKRLHSLGGHDGTILSLDSFVVNGCSFLASSASDATVRIWDWQRGTCTSIMGGHQEWVHAVVAGTLDDDVVIASAGDDGIIRLWHPNGAPAITSTVSNNSIRNLAMGKVGGLDVLLAASAQGDVLIWRPDRGVFGKIPANSVLDVASTENEVAIATRQGVFVIDLKDSILRPR